MTDIIPITQSLAKIGQVANAYAARNVFSDYQKGKAPNTLRRQKDGLTLFSAYLKEAGVHVDVDDLINDPQTWENMTQGLVKGFVRWLLRKGYAIGSINVHLSTVKLYCRLASEARIIPPSEYGMIVLVKSIKHSDGRNIDKQREVSRIGQKKAEPTSISREQAQTLKTQPDTPQGRRDELLMCLLLDHGLRCGEIAGLKLEHFNLFENTFTFYREKVDKIQTHMLTKDTRIAINRYLEICTPQDTLLVGSRKGGKLQGSMTTRAITMRVATLAKRAGIEKKASAHDGRHAWATLAVRNGTDIKSLQDAGGWSSPAMPLRYVESNKIANEGVKLG